MKALEFKKVVSEVKEILKGKTLNIHLIENTGSRRLTFTSLKSFGNAILDLESKSAGFGFDCVKNDIITKGIGTPSNFQKVLKGGVWNEVTFIAALV